MPYGYAFIFHVLRLEFSASAKYYMRVLRPELPLPDAEKRSSSGAALHPCGGGVSHPAASLRQRHVIYAMMALIGSNC
jgi:hypothetical protein